MTFKEYCKRSYEIRMTHDIILLADLIQLYNEKYKIDNANITFLRCCF